MLRFKSCHSLLSLGVSFFALKDVHPGLLQVLDPLDKLTVVFLNLECLGKTLQVVVDFGLLQQFLPGFGPAIIVRDFFDKSWLVLNLISNHNIAILFSLGLRQISALSYQCGAWFLVKLLEIIVVVVATRSNAN